MSFITVKICLDIFSNARILALSKILYIEDRRGSLVNSDIPVERPQGIDLGRRHNAHCTVHTTYYTYSTYLLQYFILVLYEQSGFENNCEFAQLFAIFAVGPLVRDSAQSVSQMMLPFIIFIILR